MKKVYLIILALFILNSISFALTPSQYDIPAENHLKYFEPEHWWLKSYTDILSNSKFFYTPLENDDLFIGIYHRFQNNKLVMNDAVAKEDISYKTLYKYLKTLGEIKEYKEIPYVNLNVSYTIKNAKGKNQKVYTNNLSALLISNGKINRLAFVPNDFQKNYSKSLLAAHIKAMSKENKKKENTIAKTKSSSKKKHK